MYNKLKRIARESYYYQILNKYKNDIKNTWKTLGPLIGKGNEKRSIIEKFVVNGENISDPDLISNAFCEFFSNIGCKLQENIPVSRTSYDNYLRRPEEKTLFLNPTTTPEILEIFRSIKSKKSIGHDGISSHLLKKLSECLAYPICLLINRSIQEGHVPDCMKIAKVLPLYKSKEKDQMTNYRPISLLPALSKVLEKVIHKRVYSFLNGNSRLYKHQYGFRKRHSTMDAVAQFVYDSLLAYDNNEYTIAVFLDLSKAFDTIDIGFDLE